MNKQRPVWIVIVLCSFTIGLTSCQNLQNPFANLFGPPAETSGSPPPLACTATDNDSARRLKVLEAENAKLKQDNAMLKDLAAKKW